MSSCGRRSAARVAEVIYSSRSEGESVLVLEESAIRFSDPVLGSNNVLVNLLQCLPEPPDMLQSYALATTMGFKFESSRDAAVSERHVSCRSTLEKDFHVQAADDDP